MSYQVGRPKVEDPIPFRGIENPLNDVDLSRFQLLENRVPPSETNFDIKAGFVRYGTRQFSNETAGVTTAIKIFIWREVGVSADDQALPGW